LPLGGRRQLKLFACLVLYADRAVSSDVLINADLRPGRHGQLIGELEGLLAEQPTRERIAGQLMLAVNSSGGPVHPPNVSAGSAPAL
jgi:hypothetical protein